MNINILISFFMIYSFLGWIVESIYKTIRTKKLINSGFLYGPFCPIYGFGALIMLAFLRYFQGNIVVLFISGFIILSVWEYIVSFLIEKILKTKYWDYSTYKCNINGRVCLLNSFFWGFLSVVFIKIVHPPVQSLINNVPSNQLNYINLCVFFILVIDCIFSVVKLYNIKVSLDLMSDITKSIKQNLDKIKQFAGQKAKESEKLQFVIEELKQKQELLKNKLEKQTARLRNAFPTMKSMRTSEMINQRKDSIKKNK